jgi:hypothetical protein
MCKDLSNRELDLLFVALATVLEDPKFPNYLADDRKEYLDLKAKLLKLNARKLH